MVLSSPKSKSKRVASSSPKSTTAVVEILSRPKRPLSAYNLFFAEERVKLLASLPVRPEGVPRKSHGKMPFKEMAVTIGALWKATKPEDRKKFEEQAKEEKIRYKKRLAEWKLLLKNSKKKKMQYDRIMTSGVSVPPLRGGEEPSTSASSDDDSIPPPSSETSRASVPTPVTVFENDNSSSHMDYSQQGIQEVPMAQPVSPALSSYDTTPYATVPLPFVPQNQPQDSLGNLMRNRYQPHYNSYYEENNGSNYYQATMPHPLNLPHPDAVFDPQETTDPLLGMAQLARRMDEQETLDLFLDLFQVQQQQQQQQL